MATTNELQAYNSRIDALTEENQNLVVRNNRMFADLNIKKQ